MHIYIYLYIYIYIYIYIQIFISHSHLKTKPQNHFFLISLLIFLDKKTSKQPNFPSREGTSERLSCIWETPQQPPTLEWIEAPADFDSTVGFYSALEANHRGEDPVVSPKHPQNTKDQTAFLQNRVMAMVGWNQPQKDVHFSKRGENSNRIQSTPWKTSQRYCSVYLNLHKAYSWKDNSLGWSPTLDAGLNESLLHIPYSKRTRWMETGMEMKRFWQVQDLMAPMWGDMPQVCILKAGNLNHTWGSDGKNDGIWCLLRPSTWRVSMSLSPQ